MANELQKKDRKQSESNLIKTMTKRQATRGKIVRLKTEAKAQAALITNRADRRHYLNLQLDAASVETEGKNAARSRQAAKDTEK